MIDPTTFVPFFDDDTVAPRALLGTVAILGQPFHVQAIRVERSPHGGQRVPFVVWDEGDDDPVGDDIRDLLEKLRIAEDATNFATVNLPGREGEWVLWIVPYED